MDESKLLTSRSTACAGGDDRGRSASGYAEQAMSPIGRGSGSNLAVQDAVAAANIVATSTPRRARSCRGQRYRADEAPSSTRVTQWFAGMSRTRVIGRVIGQPGKSSRFPWPLEAIEPLWPFLRREDTSAPGSAWASPRAP